MSNNLAVATCSAKACSRCGELRPATAEFFHRDRSARDGFASRCKPCGRRISREWMRLRHGYQPRTRRPLESTRICRKCGQDKPATPEFFALKATGRGGLYSVCKLCDAQRAARYRKENPPDYSSPARLAISRRWRAENPERARQLYRESQKRRRTDGRYRVSAAMSVRIWKSLKGKGGVSWEKLVGYKRGELVAHLERQFTGRMSWSNYGWKWHIDHIRPVSSFGFSSSSDDEFRACWALTNLQPLLKRQNLLKRDHLTHLI